MAKVRVKGIKSVFNSINAIFDNSIKKDSFLNMLKDFVVLRIQAETRKGKDLSRDGAVQPGLSDGYVRMREKFQDEKSVRLSKFFRVDFSNLTLTGQMLDSLAGKVLPRLSQIEISVSGNRDDGETNSGVAKDLASRGRTFLGLDVKGRVRLRKFVLDELRKQIRLRK